MLAMDVSQSGLGSRQMKAGSPIQQHGPQSLKFSILRLTSGGKKDPSYFELEEAVLAPDSCRSALLPLTVNGTTYKIDCLRGKLTDTRSSLYVQSIDHPSALYCFKIGYSSHIAEVNPSSDSYTFPREILNPQVHTCKHALWVQFCRVEKVPQNDDVSREPSARFRLGAPAGSLNEGEQTQGCSRGRPL